MKSKRGEENCISFLNRSTERVQKGSSMKDTEKGWPKGLRRGNELKKEGFSLSDLVMTSDLETFPDGFFSAHLLT